MRLSRFGAMSVIAFAVTLSSGPARADDAGSKALAAAEAAVFGARTHYFEYEATTLEPGKAEKRVAFNLWLKGEKRLTEYVSPADMKGTKVLTLSPTEVYVYLPAFGKVRRIASHTSDQSSFGMAFSQGELTPARYSGECAANQNSATDKEIKITLTPLAGKTPTYGKIQMTIAKDKNLPTELKYFDATGKNVKNETRSGYTCEGAICTPGTVKMVDVLKNVTTTLTRKKWKVNENINDDVFSKRNLGE